MLDITEKCKELRAWKIPSWFAEWTDYPHRGWTLDEAKEIRNLLLSVERNLPGILEALEGAQEERDALLGEPEAVHLGAQAAITALRQCQQVVAERDSLRVDKERLEAAAKALIARLQEMERPLNDLCVFRQVHGMPYTGPNWGEPLKALKEAAGLTSADHPPATCICNPYAESGPVERAPNCKIHGIGAAGLTGGEGNV